MFELFSVCCHGSLGFHPHFRPHQEHKIQFMVLVLVSYPYYKRQLLFFTLAALHSSVFFPKPCAIVFNIKPRNQRLADVGFASNISLTNYTLMQLEYIYGSLCLI